MKKLTDFSFCKFLFVLGFTTLLAACSEESTDKVNNVINSSSETSAKPLYFKIIKYITH